MTERIEHEIESIAQVIEYVLSRKHKRLTPYEKEELRKTLKIFAEYILQEQV